MSEFINLTGENLAEEHLCCIIRSKVKNPGVEAKREWLAKRIPEGHIFRKLDEKATAFIEYAPLEKAWVPIFGENYFYIYCLWTYGNFRDKGYGKELMEYCIADAKAKGKSGICLLGAKKQKAWLTDQNFAKGFGFEAIDETADGYELLALSFDGTKPRFSETAKKQEIENKKLTIFYDVQCPYIYQNIEGIKVFCKENSIPASFIFVDSLEKAKNLPCVFNNWAVFLDGKFRTLNVSDTSYIKKLLKI